jgi:hypothetical protein
MKRRPGLGEEAGGGWRGERKKTIVALVPCIMGKTLTLH